MSAGCVIVGAGHGGFHTANALREAGYTQPITIIDEHAGAPYERPPLSKKYLLGEIDREGLAFRSAKFYELADITLVVNTRVVSIDRDHKKLRLTGNSGGISQLEYDVLVLATGSKPRPFDVPGATHPAVHRLATVANAEALGKALEKAQRLLVIGSGFIGLESAAVAVERGLNVAVLYRGLQPLSRSVSGPTARYLQGWHASRGVTFHPNTAITQIKHAHSAHPDGVTAVDAHGREFEGDVVIVGIGAEPVTALAEQAGLSVDRGVIVDASLRTTDPNIFAIGDCARFPHARYGSAMRLESVQNAADHARTVAENVVAGRAQYSAVPWFWSDQSDLKLQIAGITTDADTTVVRGDISSGRFSIFAFREGVLTGVESVRKAADHVVARKLLAGHTSLTPEQASDLSFNLRSLVA